MEKASRSYFRAGRINTMVRRYLGLAKNRAGSAAIEFVIVAPLLCTMLLGMIQFAFIFNNISVLANATAAGALLFSQGRSFTSPYSSAVTAVKSAAGSLTTANLTITSNQCHQGITAAQAAARAGTWVYAVAYGASTSSSSSCTTDTPAISACSAMQQMASDQTKFFSDAPSVCVSVNTQSALSAIFSGIAGSLSKARLIPSSTT